jgi:predicted ArsR family transcriptional regulator
MLRRGERTVEELAAELGVTDNAVRAQLQTLEREGVVHQSRIRRDGTVGKPATMYAIHPDAEALFSAAYAPVLGALLATLEDRMTQRQLDAVFRDVGRRLSEATRNVSPEGSEGAGEDAGGSRGGSVSTKQLEARVRNAAAALTALGGDIDVERSADGFRLRGHACPLLKAVQIQPKTCRAIEELVARLTGVEVRGCCERSGGERGTAKCCFEVKR